jgi:hypothetical protein
MWTIDKSWSAYARRSVLDRARDQQGRAAFGWPRRAAAVPRCCAKGVLQQRQLYHLWQCLDPQPLWREGPLRLSQNPLPRPGSRRCPVPRFTLSSAPLCDIGIRCYSVMPRRRIACPGRSSSATEVGMHRSPLAAFSLSWRCCLGFDAAPTTARPGYALHIRRDRHRDDRINHDLLQID